MKAAPRSHWPVKIEQACAPPLTAAPAHHTRPYRQARAAHGIRQAPRRSCASSGAHGARAHGTTPRRQEPQKGGAHRPEGLQAGVGPWGAVSLTPHPLQGLVETRPRLGLQEGQRLAVWASPQTQVRAPEGHLTLGLRSSRLRVHRGAWTQADPRAGGL